MSDTGSESVGMTVATKRRRNRKITSTTRAMVPMSVSVTSCSASRTDRERSFTGVIFTEAGIWLCRSGKAARIESTTRTVLAPGWRCTARVMEGSPFRVAQLLRVSRLSSTVATSRRRTGLPPLVLTMRSANSAALRSCLLACSTRVCLGPSSVPTGVLTLAALSAALISSRPMLRTASASGLTRTRTAYRLAPNTLTWATPSTVDKVGTIRCSA